VLTFLLFYFLYSYYCLYGYKRPPSKALSTHVSYSTVTDLVINHLFSHSHLVVSCIDKYIFLSLGFFYFSTVVFFSHFCHASHSAHLLQGSILTLHRALPVSFLFPSWLVSYPSQYSLCWSPHLFACSAHLRDATVVNSEGLKVSRLVYCLLLWITPTAPIEAPSPHLAIFLSSPSAQLWTSSSNIGHALALIVKNDVSKSKTQSVKMLLIYLP
jgi:hypothetical protein